MDVTSRAPALGPAFLHLLARIGAAGAPAGAQPLAARLAHWIDWRQAVALSAALEPRVAAPPAPSAGDDGEYDRVRAALVRAIEGDRAFAVAAAEPCAADPAFYRQRHVTLQQMMEAESGHLRGRIRQRLAREAGDAARLAALDAAMERALGRHERTLLAALPDLLGTHFERLRAAADAAADAAPPWLDRFRDDMRGLLLAELDFRLQPAHGLQAALRSTASGSHAP